MKRVKSNFRSTAKRKRTQALSDSASNAGVNSFPLVGVGASAGGLEAFTKLLQHLPVDTGMGFVLVQHLDPLHESALCSLLSKVTLMPVREVTDDMRVKPNCVYVIPPNANLAIKEGVLKLQPRRRAGGAHRSIDFFFESLAQDQRERAIGVVLSGTATDGTAGLEAIKAEGGIAFAQDESAKYDSMPRSAIAAGCVDFILSPENIAKELARIAQHPFVAPASPGGKKAALPSREIRGTERPRSAKWKQREAASPEEDGFKKILLILRNHCGVDFSLYKSTTIQRRITRRMVLNKQNTLEDYATFLRCNAKELDALYSDTLISVTSFFRNPEAFDVLKRKIFPRLVEHRRAEPVRVWVLGCSTGQEAYSIAMSFAEFADKVTNAPRLQVFATDLNEELLDKARHGLYSKNLADEVSPERLRRFFVEEQGGYRVSKTLREMCVFARQNLISDPPFSRMDLVSCRNVMIYLEPELQKKLLPTFHYALKPHGFLFLGASESIGSFTDLFESLDKKQKIFAKKSSPTPGFHLPISRGYAAERKGAPVIKRPGASEEVHDELSAQREADRLTVNQFAPPSVLINADLQILQFRGPTSAYLVPPTGKASFNILKMAREDLMLPLRTAINRAKKENKRVRREDVFLSEKDATRTVTIEVVPLKNLRERCFLVLFEEKAEQPDTGPHEGAQRKSSKTAATISKRPSKEEHRRIADLERELVETRDYLQSVQEQYEATNEDLQASNEEVQSANEELQSINEELETSKEELESTNEELTTVNEEMSNRNAELSRLNGDLVNLQNSVHTAIVLLGRDLTIRRFTPLAEKMFSLLATDVGRPIASVRHNLVFADSIPHRRLSEEKKKKASHHDVPTPTDLESFLAEVIDSVKVREHEVQDRQGHWYSLRARPYLTLDNKIDGAVLMLVDIDALKRTEAEIKEARNYANAIVESVPPILILDDHLRVETANQSFYKTFRVTRIQTEHRPIYDLGNGQWNGPELRKRLEEILPRNKVFHGFEVTHEFENIGHRTMLVHARRLDDQPRILLVIDDVTERVEAQNKLRASEHRYRQLFESAKDGILIIDPETQKITEANPSIAELLGYTREEFSGRELWEFGLLRDQEASKADFRKLREKHLIRYDNLPLKTKSGKKIDVEFVANLYRENSHFIVQCNIRDVTERRTAARELAEKARLLDLTHDAIIVRDLEDKISLWNKGAERLYGWTCEEVIDKDLHSLLQTEFPRPMEEIVEQLHREGQFTGEVVQITRDGRRIPSLCRWVFDHETKSILTSYTDISERKRTEEELRESQERYRNLFNSIDEGFCIIEVIFDNHQKPIDYRFLEVNPSFAKQTGIHDPIDKRIREIAPGHESYWFEIYGQVALTGEPIRFVRQAKAMEGRWFDVYAFRIDHHENHKIAVLFSNITERIQTEKALRESQEQIRQHAGTLEETINERTGELQKSIKSLEGITYTMAHDLRAPIRAMKAYSEALMEDVPLEETGRNYAERIQKAAGRMDQLVNDLLDYSQLTHVEFPIQTLNLKTEIDRVLFVLSKEIQAAHASIQVQEPMPSVQASETLLEQILSNLLLNSLKFVAPGVKPVVRLHSEISHSIVRLWIEDNGIGIPREYHEKIFGVFKRLHTAEAFPGTGVGLAIAKRAVERMGGSIGVESVPNQGSRFWIELPAADAAG